MLKAKYYFRDNNGKVAEMTVKLGPGDNFAGALSATLALVSYLAAVSSATLYRVEVIYHDVTVSPAPPGPASDVRADTVLFYRNGLDTSSIRVPSIAGVHFETTGHYAGKRITRESAALSGVLTSLDNLLTGCLDDLGRPYGSSFIVGGSTRL